MFLITSVPIDTITGCLVVYIGKSTSNLDELFTDKTKKMQRNIFICVLILSLIIIIYLFFLFK